jgi:hypothetical protein
MSEWVASGLVVDLVLAVMALEALLIALFAGRRRGALLLGLLPGLVLLLALRAALVGAGWMWVAGLLALSLPFHLADLRRRLG